MDPGQHSPAALLADPADHLPQWRDRLERLWVQQASQITGLSLAFRDAAAAGGAAGNLRLAEAHVARLQQIVARMASAHRGLAEIEAALRRVDTGRYGLCEQCGLRMPTDWLDAAPQARYCPQCRAYIAARPSPANCGA